jgi:hypothetical protein
MKTPFVLIVSILAAVVFHGFCHASSESTYLVYQPIDMRSEGTVIRLPQEGFIILAVPYASHFNAPENPYGAITLPYGMLSRPLRQGAPDSNLVSRAGIKIESQCTFDGKDLKEELVTVDVSKFEAKEYEPALEVIAEATLECIRRTATDEHQQWLRPVLKIIGKPADEALWKRWENAFNHQDFSKPFKRPDAPAGPDVK